LEKVDDKGEATPVKVRSWTRVDDYFEALARRRTARRAHQPKPRTEPEAPRFSLSTLPFLGLFLGLAILAIGIAVSAWPGSQPQAARYAAKHDKGYAAKGWLQEAQKEMRR
jgi:hypothetical protein